MSAATRGHEEHRGRRTGALAGTVGRVGSVGRHRPKAAALLALLGLLATTRGGALAARTEEPKLDSCVACHAELPEALGAPVEGMKSDVHARHGISCADCHGGDPRDPGLESMAPERGYRGAPTAAEIPDLCAHCHSDPAYMRRFNPSLPTNQRERYRTSVHGQRLQEGDDKVATCVSCHGVHGILPGKLAGSPVYPANIPATCGHCHSSAEYMAGYDIPTDQEKHYRASVHGDLLLVRRDLSAPTCTTCHDNHGASPPGVTSIAEVCGQCHVTNAALLTASTHKAAFDRLGLSECASCHGNHEIHRSSDTLLGVDGTALCGRCHPAGSPSHAAAKEMRGTIDRLKENMRFVDAALGRAEAIGMEVSDARYEFHEAETILIRARTAVHRFSPPYLLEVTAPGFEVCQKTERSANAAIAEGLTRRADLLLPLALIALLMLLLWLKLRRLEDGPGGGG